MKALSTLLGCLLLLLSAGGGAVEPLSRAQLAQLCADADEPASARASQCELYILGFLDGAVTRGQRTSSPASDDSFIDRAASTRLGAPPRGALQRFAGYCLATPLPLDAVIEHVREALARPGADAMHARDLLHDTLRRHYPCPS